MQGNNIKRVGLSGSVSISFFKVTSVLNELPFWTLLWGNFDVLITLSLFELFELFDSLMLICEIMLVHIILILLGKKFLQCFLHEKVYLIYIYLSIEK